MCPLASGCSRYRDGSFTETDPSRPYPSCRRFSLPPSVIGVVQCIIL